MSVREEAKRGLGPGGLARWWARWWLDTRGPVLGVGVPVVLAVVAAALEVRLMPLALAGGLAAGLLWPMGMAARGLAITGGVVLLTVAFVAATGPAGILALFAMLVGWGFVALLAGGLYLLFRRPRINPHYAARWASQEDTLEMVMWEEGHHPGEGVSLGVHYGELVGVRPGFEGRREMGHFLVCGPSRSGKSLHLITNLLVWQGSAVALDFKGELFRLPAGIRKEMGDDVFALDPQGRGSRYDPFRELFHSPEGLNVVRPGRMAIFFGVLRRYYLTGHPYPPLPGHRLRDDRETA